ncbi:MAG: hypothetical protein B6242_03555 [Anaerolineaceae bacterium 4572_78]|nr:MAG: hypothetical protein B6242_03555 [Anaerolineaceae bacterium 4572_78]
MKSDTLFILILKLNQQTYGITVNHIMQIIDMVTITPLPLTHSAIRGVINFRGEIVPVIDLRLRLNFAFKPYQLHTPIILTHFDGRKLGVVVDDVEDIIEIFQESIEEDPLITTLNIAKKEKTPPLFGLAKIDKEIIPILHLEELLTKRDLTQLEQVLGK